VIVDDSQLSLAIGKKGQNVRLAAKLLGWKIDIKSEEEKRQEVELQMQALVGSSNTPLDRVEGLGEGLIGKLAEAGVTTVEALADMTPEQLEAIDGIGPKTVEKISIAVNNYFSSLETGEVAAEETAEVAAEEAAAGEEAPEAGAPEAEEAAAAREVAESSTLEGAENASVADVAEVQAQDDELPESEAAVPGETVEPEEPKPEDSAAEK
jgi:N utilization substance protein A